MLLGQFFFAGHAAAQVQLAATGHTNNGGAGYRVIVLGDYAYLANGTDGLRIYDISDPANPHNVGHTNNSTALTASFQDLALSGPYAFLANANDGLRVYDVSDATQPKGIAHTNDSTALRAYASGVDISGDHLFVANGTDGLRIYDVSNPAQPVGVGHVTGFYGQNVRIFGEHAYVLSSTGFRIFDISNPLIPVQIGSTNAGGPGTSEDIVVANGFAFVASGLGGLRVFDVSNPEMPVGVGGINNGGSAAGLALSGQFLYLANKLDGLRIYDVSNPANPLNVGHVNVGGFVQTVDVAGPRVFLGTTTGLHVYAVLPQLSVSPDGSDAFQVSWPATADFALEESADLDGEWTVIGVAPSAIGSRRQVIVPIGEGTRFYRLAF